MAYSYKGNLTFGLVYIPITLQLAIKEQDVRFHMLDKKTMSRVKYLKTCVDCDERIIKTSDIVKGYEYEDGKYVIMEDSDFEKLKTKRDKNIVISQFVKLSEVDPLYFDRTYYVTPQGAEQAFMLLLKALEEEKKVGIAKTVLGSKETLLLVRAHQGTMLITTLYFHDELQARPRLAEVSKTSAAEIKMAKAVIQSMTSSFDPKQYHDEYRKRIQEAIEAKIAGRHITKHRERKTAAPKDLMDALKKTLAANMSPKKKRTTRSTLDS